MSDDENLQNEYKIKSSDRGYCIVIMMKEFNSENLLERKCAQKDLEVVRKLFEDKLGFNVKISHSPTKDEISDLLTETAFQISEDDSAFVLFFASHTGRDNNHLHARDGEVKIQEIINQCNDSTLAGKLKLFIVQSDREGDTNSYDSLGDQTANVPREADIFQVTCNIDGRQSFQDENGSWFVKTFVGVFNEDAATREVMKMFTTVWQRMYNDERYKHEEGVGISEEFTSLFDFHLRPVDE